MAFLILAPSVLIFFRPPKAHADWFDDNYAYRQKISFTHNADITSERAITFSLDTAELITAGVMQADCDDTRFTDSNGKLLRYQLTGTCNNAATTYEVVFPRVFNGANPAFVYYGNPQAAYASVNVSSVTALTPSGGDPSITTRTSEEKAPSPAAYLKFDENNGTTTQDQSPNNNDGTISGAAWKEKQFCLSENCLFFDGTDDVVTVTNADSIDMDRELAGALTFQAWIRPNGAGEGTGGQIFYKGTNTWLRIDTLSNGKLDIEASLNLATPATLNVSSAIDNNNWNFIVLSYTDDADDEITIWVNGKNLGSSTNGIGAPSADTNNFLIGGTTTNNFQGFIDEVKIYPTERTATQVKTETQSITSLHGLSAAFGPDESYLSNGLVGYWKMDDGVNNPCASGVDKACDSSGNGNVGTWKNGVASTSGKFANATNYDGTDDYLEASTVNGTNKNEETVSVWIRPTTITGNHVVIDLGHGGFSVQDDLLIRQSGANISFRLWNGSSYQDITASGVLAVNTWTHVAALHSVANRRAEFYVNGELKGTMNTYTDSSNNHSFVNIGRDFQWLFPTDYFKGQIDDVRIYNRALSPSEIRSLYDWAPGPVGWWKMDERAGTSAYDTSGNANTGTLNNGPVWTTGKIGQALNFDGTNDYISTGVTLSNFITASAGTISVWVKPKGTALSAASNYDGDGIIIDGGGSGYFGINRANATTTNCAGGENGDRIYVYNWDVNEDCVAVTYTVNEWVHITAVHSGGTLYAYKNGQLVNSKASGDTNYLGGNLQIGRSYDDVDYFEGQIDDVRIYNYARTPKQIISDMNAGHPAVGTPVGSTVGHWSFDEGGGTLTAYDKSPLQNNLTLSATAYTANGKFGKVWDGDGIKYLSRADDDDFDFTAADDISISTWFRSDSATNPSTREYLLNKSLSGGTQEAGYALYVEPDGTVCLAIDDDATWTPDVSACSTSDVYDQLLTFHHIVGIRNVSSDKLLLYVDGKLQGSTTDTTTATLANGRILYLGDRDGTDNGDELSKLQKVFAQIR